MTPYRDADEAALEPFFAAARAEAPAPPMALVSAILADAADAVPRPAPGPVAPARWRPGRIFAPIGGWRGLAALGACAAVGFWVGLAGGVTVDGTTVWAGSATSDLEVSADPVGDFFDLASAEN